MCQEKGRLHVTFNFLIEVRTRGNIFYKLSLFEHKNELVFTKN